MKKTVLLFALALLAACSQNTDPSTAAYWLERLEDPAKQQEALSELGKIGDKAALPQVLALFEAENENQPYAAYALGKLGDPSAVPVLVGAIDYRVGTGRDSLTRRKNSTNQNIAKALTLLKAKDGVEPLINLLETPDQPTRLAVITALGKLGDFRATDALVEIALEEPQPFIRKTAIVALGQLADPKAVPALVQMLYIPLPGTSFYYEARYSLIQIGKPAIALLRETLARKNKEVEAIRLPSGDPIADGAIEAKVAFVLGSLKATEATKEIVGVLENYYKTFKSSKSPLFASIPGAISELAYALGLMESPEAIGVLEKIAQDTDASLRIAATEALTQVGAKQSVPKLFKAARTGSLQARRHAVVAISQLGSGKDLAAFDQLSSTADKNVSAKELKAMLEQNRVRLASAKECKGDKGCWQKKIGDQDPLVRERASWQLGWLGAKDAVPALLKAAEDDDNRVRLAAVAALSRMDEGLDTNTLQAIHDKWKSKIEYKDTNANLRRLVARLKSR